MKFNKKFKPSACWIFSLGMVFLLVIIFVLVMRQKIFFQKYFQLSPPDYSSSLERSAFEDNFDGRKEKIEETAKKSESSSTDWWVNSGGGMEISDGTGKTIQGELSHDSKWRKKYAKSNPKDTDGGTRPQNIFRLVTRTKWQNFRQEAYFRINKLNLSASENRNESNGILLFNRYENGDNLYYTGVRVDGSAVIKKKYGGKYFTMDEKKFFPGTGYDRDENPNLLPLGVWIGLKSEVKSTAGGDVEIKLFVRVGQDGEWKLAASVTDDGRKEFGENILSGAGHAGIRTDFLDVDFDQYRITEL